MSDEDFDEVKRDLVEAMLAVAKAQTQLKPTSSADATQPSASVSSKSQRKQALSFGVMFRGLNTKGKAKDKQKDDDTNMIRDMCKGELDRFLLEAEKGVCPLEAEDVTFSNPLLWWKENATSAISERVWSHSAKVLSLHRARLNDDLIERIMYIKENMRLLKKHYSKLRKAEVESHSHFLVDMEMKFFPELDTEFAEANADYGQNDHKLGFFVNEKN
ncbi:hypothetical protein ACHAWO_002698 [Cyclotella atomus]|uniref:HAT C-terminal dimerisation domain-containing protein n=1 Tax=Cyclotella atomus TaxID=382360 RepID=A0ABD3NIG2_9STRA